MNRFHTGTIITIFLLSIVLVPTNPTIVDDFTKLNEPNTLKPDLVRKDGQVKESSNTLVILDKFNSQVSKTVSIDSITSIDALFPNGLARIHNKLYLELNLKLDNIQSDDLEILQSILVASGSEIIQSYEENGFYIIATPISKLSAVKLKIDGISGVQGYEPNYLIDIQYVVDDPLFSSQWGPELIGIEDAWGSNIPHSRDILVAVLDTGIDYTHPDLEDQYLPIGYDFSNDDEDPMDDHGHGTHVAGTIAASIDNGKGIAGMADVSIFAEKILDVNGSGYYSQAILGIEHAVDNGARILSNSWGGTAYSTLLEAAVNYAVDNGALFIAASGNDNENIPHYPASYENAISVASTTSSDERSWFSNYHDTVDISAPGSSILSTYPSNSYVYRSGTSMATPHVSGLAALIMSKYPSFEIDTVKSIIYNTSDDLGDPGYDIYFGHGRINASQAINTILYDDLTVELGVINYFTNSSSTYYNFSLEVGSSHDEIDANISITLDRVVVVSKEVSTISNKYSGSFMIDIGDFTNISVMITNSQILDPNGSNNVDTLIINTIEVTNSKLLEGDETLDDTSSSALLPVNLNISNSESVQLIILYVNTQLIANFSNPVDELIIPLLSVGLNEIEIIGNWEDGGIFSTTFEIELTRANRIIDIGPADDIVWLNSDVGIDEISFTEIVGEEIHGVINTISGSRYTITDFKLNLMNGFIIYNSSIPSIVPWIVPYLDSIPLLPVKTWDTLFSFDSTVVLNNTLLNKFSRMNDSGELTTYQNNLVYEGSDGSSLISSTLISDEISFELYIESPEIMLYNQSNELHLVVNNTGDLVLSGYELTYTLNNEIITESKDMILYPKMEDRLSISLFNDNLGNHDILFSVILILFDNSKLYYTLEYSYKIMDLTPPNLSVPEYTELAENIIFTWSAYDDFPDKYSININGGILVEETWISGTTNTFEYYPSTGDNFTITFTIYDISGNYVQYSLKINLTQQENGFINFISVGFIITSIIAIIITINYRRKY